jgi:hypothetical protein
MSTCLVSNQAHAVPSTIPTFDTGEVLRRTANSLGGSAPKGLLKGNAGSALSGGDDEDVNLGFSTRPTQFLKLTARGIMVGRANMLGEVNCAIPKDPAPHQNFVRNFPHQILQTSTSEYSRWPRGAVFPPKGSLRLEISWDQFVKLDSFEELRSLRKILERIHNQEGKFVNEISTDLATCQRVNGTRVIVVNP